MASTSPFSSGAAPDTSPVSSAAVATATDEVLWALISELKEKGIIDEETLAAKVDAARQGYMKSKQLSTQEDYDELATSLALQRVIKALGGDQ